MTLARPPFPDFDVDGVWLDSSYYHPAPRGARRAVAAYMDFRAGVARLQPANTGGMQLRVREAFARLIGASPDEVAYVPSATVGENLICAALGLGPGSRVVTDSLHYAGALRIYEGLADRGVDVEVLKPWGGRILLEDLEEALERPTDLVAVSAVSTTNGFRHDLSALCRLAHGKGALVYADIMQVVGARPFDVRASGVDFCATSSYKWLMGEQGQGFLYVRLDLLDRLGHPQFGSRQSPTYPLPVGAVGKRFEVGTLSLSTIAGLEFSLAAILDAGVEAIAAHGRPMLERLRRELPAYGLVPLTPEDSDGPVLSLQTADAPALIAALRRAEVFVSVFPDSVRIAPSMFNTDADIDRLLEAISAA